MHGCVDHRSGARRGPPPPPPHRLLDDRQPQRGRPKHQHPQRLHPVHNAERDPPVARRRRVKRRGRRSVGIVPVGGIGHDHHIPPPRFDDRHDCRQGQARRGDRRGNGRGPGPLARRRAEVPKEADGEEARQVLAAVGIRASAIGARVHVSQRRPPLARVAVPLPPPRLGAGVGTKAGDFAVWALAQRHRHHIRLPGVPPTGPTQVLPPQVGHRPRRVGVRRPQRRRGGQTDRHGPRPRVVPPPNRRREEAQHHRNAHPVAVGPAHEARPQRHRPGHRPQRRRGVTGSEQRAGNVQHHGRRAHAVRVGRLGIFRLSKGDEEGQAPRRRVGPRREADGAERNVGRSEHAHQQQ
ncbi:hypothetical protein BU14_1974s0001 [Porphyra umbilicalis]|uniref:Uncharacterized protein n=1 Tax=Porphyra umbilicalis TaxID=2786 RepID=A0A1X6NK73_PORUM|nr:hypothetical protein BU14_1974s0001 [Porphyra umbilicalis]|eukprot:OSX69007.1 hypothetical protein BU14_1974s0001 [Porphyra umbilicalis]